MSETINPFTGKPVKITNPPKAKRVSKETEKMLLEILSNPNVSMNNGRHGVSKEQANNGFNLVESVEVPYVKTK